MTSPPGGGIDARPKRAASGPASRNDARMRLQSVRSSVVFETSWAENSGRREVMLTRTLGVRGGAVHRNLDHTYEFVAELYEDRRGELVEVDAKRYAQPALVPARAFARAIAGGAPARERLPDVETGLRLAEVLEAIYRSAREGREVALDEVRARRAREAT